MLKGGGALNPDGLALDLAFALDRSFTTDPAAAGNALITSRRGPAAKFSRGSGATQVNAAGLIEYAPENLIFPSGSATNSASTYFTRVVTGDLDPDGDTTAEFTSLTTGSQARLQYAGILGFSYFSVWVKAKEGSPLPAYMHLVAGDGPRVAFNTSSWATVNDFGAIGSVEYGANGWVKLRSLFPATTASALYKIVVTDGPTYGDGIAAGKVFILGGKQVSRNPSSQHYKTTSSVFHGPRFDHDPTTGDSKGLLIEESRSNICLRSENFGTTWSTFNSSTSLISQVAPNGDPSAYSLVESVGLGIHSIFQSIAFAGTTNYTFSVFVKAGSRDFVSLVEQSSGGVIRRTFFNLSTGEVGTKNASHTASTQQLPNGWWRLIISFTSGTAASANIAIELASADNVSSYLGNGSGNAFLWGAQLEAGAFPTSYIPTTTSGTVPRAADVCSIIGDDFSSFYNQSEGSVLVATSIQNFGGNNRGIWGINNNTASHGFLTYTDGALSSVLSQSRSVSATTLLGSFSPTAGVTFKRILAYYPSGCSISTNGSTIATTAVTNSTQTMLTIQVGNMLGGSFQGSCHIASLRYYRKRLSNAKLQALTTP